MSGRSRLDVVALYVPANRPALFDKALTGPADVVIIDLEDAVPPAGKQEARDHAHRWLTGRATAERARVSVRVNAVGTAEQEADLALLAGLAGLHSVRVPKVESPGDVAAVLAATRGAHPIHALLESAAGIEAAGGIARSPGVTALAIGEADLRSDLGVTSDEGLLWCRSRVVVSARAAGLPAPMMSAWTDLGDAEGLLASCRAGRARGFLGRTAVHPAQIPAIRAGFAPTEPEVEDARQVLAGLADAESVHRAIAVSRTGQMVDRAMIRGAELTLALHAALRED